MDRAEQFWNEQGEWSQATFGKDSERGPMGPLKHLEKEAKEAYHEAHTVSVIGQEAIKDYLYTEVADCLFLTFDSARRAGMTYNDLLDFAFRKLEVNKKRKWGVSLDGQPCEHIREED